MRWRIKAWWSRTECKILDELPRRLPKRVINHLTMANLGRLTVRDPRLHTKEVPTITVQDLGNAMKYDEGMVSL